MPETKPIYVETDSTETRSRRSRRSSRRVVVVGLLLLVVLALVIVPPLFNVNRFQRRVATSMSESLGRPVHLDNVSLSLLPFPGFTLENLTIDEDPAFGSEPIIRAGSVQATLRLSSLWRRRVEFSSISFTEPSVNLVHMPDGKWNLESILIQAAHITAAPTAQPTPGSAPRFPYIEATGARVNVKWGQEKMPFSLTDADFALWLSDPQQWKVRLVGQPARTDTSASDTGTVRMEGTLGRAHSLNEVPLHLQGQWRSVPLGEASRLFLGRDSGLRGEGALSATLDGTVGSNAVVTRLRLDSVRRADFVPVHTMTINLDCQGQATEAFHAFQDVHCSWPPAGEADKEALVLTGALPNIRELSTVKLQGATQAMPNQRLIEWLQVLSARVPADVQAEGTVAAQVSYSADAPADAAWDGTLQATGLTLKSEHAGLPPMAIGDLSLISMYRAEDTLSPQPARSSSQSHRSQPAASPIVPRTFLLAPMSLDLGGKDPAILEGSLDTSGYTLHLSGMVVLSRLAALGKTIPQLGDGLEDVLPKNAGSEPIHLDLTATRNWKGPQVWQHNTLAPAPIRHPKRSR